MIVTNIIMVVIAIGIAKIFSNILKVPYSILGPSIILFAVIGSFALQNNPGDVILMSIAGIIGFAFVRCGFSSAALVLGLVLGGMTESNLRRAITLENGDIIAAISKPITIALLIACVCMLVIPVIAGMIQSKKRAA